MRKKKKWFLAAAAGLLALGVLAYNWVYVFSIKEVRVSNVPENGFVFTRYTEDLQGSIETELVTSNARASRERHFPSSDQEVAEVSADGMITARKPGSATIRITARGNRRVFAEIPVTVIQKALSMQLAMPGELPSNEYYYLVHTGDRPTFLATPDPADALVEHITYESSAPDIVTVSEDGVIEAHQSGIACIRAAWVGPYTEEGQQEELGSFWVNVCSSTDHDSLADHELQWYEESCLIAHALGNAGEYIYTNTKDALEESIEEGYRILEVDLHMTSDKEVVCRHTWYSDTFDVSYDGTIPDLATFEREKYFGTLTPLTGRGLLEIWSEHPKLWFITDVKQEENTSLTEVLNGLTDLAKEMGCEELLDHLIVQLYSVEDYAKVEAIYPIKHWLFTTYQLPDTPGAEIEAAAFSQENGFGAFTSPAWCMSSDYFIDLAKDHNLNLFVHVVDTPEAAKKSMERGIYGFYTDFLSPKDLLDAEK